MSQQDVSTPMIELTCGCQILALDQTFLMEPCRDDCESFVYAVLQMQMQDTPITFLHV